MSKVFSKKVSESKVETTYMVLPEHTNPLGNIFGGTIMAWVDITASIAAHRHCREQVVTAAVDELHFLHPVKLGDLVTLKASVNYVGTRSVEVGVKVIAENPISGMCKHTSSAYLVFVALDNSGKAQKLPELILESDEDKRRFAEGKKRQEHRKSARKPRAS